MHDLDKHCPDPSQCALILAELRRRRGKWVAMPRLSHVSGSMVVHSRIANLRTDGHRIDNRTVRGRPSKSFYRLRK